MIEIYVANRLAAEHRKKFDNETLVISITSPYVDHPHLEGENIFKFHFYDIVEEYFVEETSQMLRPLDNEMAEAIVEVAFDHRHLKRWYIHCEMGISRSPAVAIAFSEVLKTTPTSSELRIMFPDFNLHVYKTILAAAKKKLAEIEDEIQTEKL